MATSQSRGVTTKTNYVKHIGKTAKYERLERFSDGNRKTFEKAILEAHYIGEVTIFLTVLLHSFKNFKVKINLHSLAENVSYNVFRLHKAFINSKLIESLLNKQDCSSI